MSEMYTIFLLVAGSDSILQRPKHDGYVSIHVA